MKSILKKVICAMILVIVVFSSTVSAKPRNDESQQVIRVGWYDYPGMFIQDASGHRSGYGYDYLQEIARHAGWKYEYVNGTVTECLQMLEDGKVDIMGGVLHSDERARVMEFSDLSMGKNFSILSARADDTRFKIGDSPLEGVRIGVLKGDLRQSELVDYAKEQHFSYEQILFVNLIEMEQALCNKDVDLLLSTNMRVSSSEESIVAQFSPKDIYFVTTKGNQKLINEVNTNMEQIELSRKGFQSDLSRKYFSVDMSGALAFSEIENSFIQTSPVIRVVLPALRKPMAYQQGDAYEGVVVDIMDEIARRTGLKFSYSHVETQADAVAAVISGQADMISNVYDDYSWAESNQCFLTRPYMTLNYTAIMRTGEQPDKQSIRVAAVTGYRFSSDHVEQKYSRDQITWYPNEAACIEAVNQGKQDICFVSSLAASDSLTNYKYRNLYSSYISYSHGLSIGVSQNSRTLISILDKTIASMGDGKIKSIVDANTVLFDRTFSLSEIIVRYPVQFISIVGCVIFIIVLLLSFLIIMSMNRKKNDELYRTRLAAEQDSLTGLYNRLAFEVIVTQKLQTQKNHIAGAFAMIDIDLFKKYNDEHGHNYGDQVLVRLAETMKHFFLPQDAILCRMGGDEFAVFFQNVNNRKVLIESLQQFQSKLSQAGEDGMVIPCSMGVAFVSETVCDFYSLYTAADQVLYDAKNNGRGMLCVFSGGE